MTIDTKSTISPAAERITAITEALAQANGRTHFTPSESGYLELPVVELPNSLLVYRVDNGRILSELADYADHHGTPLSELKGRSETAEVQDILRGLLIEKARDPDGPVYEELETHRCQTEPLLIQYDGTVLNGNRRLAAMRELLSRDEAHYGRFSTVQVAVLPADLQQNELEFIEAALQMAPDLKLDYSWVNRRLKLRQHVRDMEPKAIVAAYRFTDAGEIDTELAELTLVEEYLDWIDQPRHYALVEAHEEAFVLLRQQLERIKNAAVADLWRLIGFAMIRAEPALDRPIAHCYPFTDPVPPATTHWVLRTLAEDHGLTERQHAGENRPLDAPLAGRLQSLIDDYHHAESTARAVVALSDTLKGNQQQLLGATRVLSQLRQARTTLEELTLSEISPSQLRQIRSEIAALYEGLKEPSATNFPPRRGNVSQRLKAFLKGRRR